MHSGIVWSCLLVQASFSLVFAQEAKPVVPVVEPVESTELGATPAVTDYGSAFARLIKLGLPDAKGAKYVKLSLHGEAGQAAERMMRQSGMGRGVDLKTKGNAWLLPEGPEGPEGKGGGGLASLIHAEYETVKVTKKQKRGGLMRLLVGPGKKSKDDEATGDWTEHDAAADAQKILKVLKDQSGDQSDDGKIFQASRWEYSDREAMWCAGVLVRACHLYRAGFTKEANQIAGRLLGMAPEPVRVIDHVMNTLAQREYRLLAETFFKDKGWVAYRDGSKSLVEKFTRGWKSSEGVKMLVHQLDQRIKGAKPVIKKLKGVSLKPEAVAIMDGWLTQEEAIVVDAPMCWILGEQTLKRCARNANVRYYIQPSKQEWVKQMVGLGMDGLIAMASAATDHSLMATKMGQSRNGYSSYSSMNYSYGGNGGDSAALAQYAALNRPCSRGEIARKMLERTLPDAENELSRTSTEELQSIAYQWWLKHRSDSPSQLVRHFFTEGNSQQQMIAMVALVKSGDGEDAKLVEKFILGHENPDRQGQMVTLYLKENKGKAKPFFDQYSKVLKEYTKGLEKNEIDWNIRTAGGVDKFLRKLEIYVKDISTDKILADIRSGKLKGKEGLSMLGAAAAEGEFAKLLPAIVSIARQQKTMEEQIELLDGVGEIMSQKYYDEARNDENSEGANNEYEKFLISMIEPSKEDWQWFLAQTEPVKNVKALNGAPSLASYMAWQMENLYFPRHQQTRYALMQALDPQELWDFGIKRANSVLKEGAKAYFPDAKLVKEERREGIRQQLKPMSAGEILKFQKGLNLDEKLAWSEMIQGFGEEQPPGIVNLRKKVVKVRWADSGEKDELLKQIIVKLALEKDIDQAMLDRFMDIMFAHANTHHDTAIAIQSSGVKGLGFTVIVNKGDWAMQMKDSVFSKIGGSLREKITKKSAAMFVYGNGDRGAESGFLRDPVVEDDAQKRKEITEVFLKKVQQGDAANIIFLSETSEAFIKRKEKEESGDDSDGYLLPPR